jgi:hypothetical protein
MDSLLEGSDESGEIGDHQWALIFHSDLALNEVSRRQSV